MAAFKIINKTNILFYLFRRLVYNHKFLTQFEPIQSKARGKRWRDKIKPPKASTLIML